MARQFQPFTRHGPGFASFGERIPIDRPAIFHRPNRRFRHPRRGHVLTAGALAAIFAARFGRPAPSRALVRQAFAVDTSQGRRTTQLGKRPRHTGPLFIGPSRPSLRSRFQDRQLAIMPARRRGRRRFGVPSRLASRRGQILSYQRRSLNFRLRRGRNFGRVYRGSTVSRIAPYARANQRRTVVSERVMFPRVDNLLDQPETVNSVTRRRLAFCITAQPFTNEQGVVRHPWNAALSTADIRVGLDAGGLMPVSELTTEQLLNQFASARVKRMRVTFTPETFTDQTPAATGPFLLNMEIHVCWDPLYIPSADTHYHPPDIETMRRMMYYKRIMIGNVRTGAGLGGSQFQAPKIYTLFDRFFTSAIPNPTLGRPATTPTTSGAVPIVMAGGWDKRAINAADLASSYETLSEQGLRAGVLWVVITPFIPGTSMVAAFNNNAYLGKITMTHTIMARDPLDGTGNIQVT